MDKKLADSYIGKHLLVGITYLDHEDNFIEHKQLHGNIVRINKAEGIVLRLHDSDEEYKQPPALQTLEPAPKRGISAAVNRRDCRRPRFDGDMDTK
jgi:hypothetical protein